MTNRTLIHEETTSDGFDVKVFTVQDNESTPYDLITNEGPEYEEENKKRIEDWDRNRWWYIGVIAEVHACGIELGYSGIWCVESDCGDKYMQELTREQTNEALGYARDKVKEIVQKFDAVAAEWPRLV